jgi:Domain of unknown function (DUF4331)
MHQQALRGSTRQLVLVAIACVISAIVAGGVFGLSRPADASSHREAPFISGDPEADATDVYAFRSPDKPSTVTLVANYVPLEVPAGGPNFYKFGDEVLYEINVDNDGDAKDDIVFQFRFNSKINNGNTFLYNTGPITSLKDPDLNQEQFYSVSVLKGETSDPQRKGKVIAHNLQVAPANVGPASYPEGYRKVANQAIYGIGKDKKVFAGPRDDPFFVDLGGTFDLLQFRALQGLKPKDDLAGLNVHTLAIQVPIKMLKGPKDSVIGVYSAAYREKTRVLRDIGQPGKPFPDPASESGAWVEISRLDLPLVNEVVIPLKDKDRWNNSEPEDDAQFLKYVQNPELGRLIEAIFGLDVPNPPRKDLVTILLTGIPDLNQPKDVKPASLLRLNMATKPSNNPDRLGVLGGDNAGFPNGRRPADDVVDIELQAIAGATPFTPKFNDKAHKLSDKVDKNDVPFLNSFPYLNTPHDYAGAKSDTSNGKSNNDSGNDKSSNRKQANAGGVMQLLQSMMQGIANILPG